MKSNMFGKMMTLCMCLVMVGFAFPKEKEISVVEMPKSITLEPLSSAQNSNFEFDLQIEKLMKSGKRRF